jgi:P27 family predicted phage terminase small subunit
VSGGAPIGARGPAPKPRLYHEQRGSWRAAQRAGEPQPAAAKPKCPPHLTAPQKKIWTAIVGVLFDMGFIAKSDWPQLERYAVMYVQWRRCLAFVEKKDAENEAKGFGVPPGCYPIFSEDTDTYVAKHGNVAIACWMEYPAVRQAHKLDVALKQIENQFGLTPAARVRLAGIGGEEPADPFEKFLNADQRTA